MGWRTTLRSMACARNGTARISGARMVACGAGRLVARIMQDSVAFDFQYFVSGQGKEVKRSLPLGEYDEGGRRGLSLMQARDRAAKLAQLYRDGATDLHAHFERQLETEERARKAEEEAARRAAEDAQRGTLRQLLDAYVGYLEKQGRPSAKDARNIFNLHVFRRQRSSRRARPWRWTSTTSSGSLASSRKQARAARQRNFAATCAPPTASLSPQKPIRTRQ
jgi:hypothetical protein